MGIVVVVMLVGSLTMLPRIQLRSCHRLHRLEVVVVEALPNRAMIFRKVYVGTEPPAAIFTTSDMQTIFLHQAAPTDLRTMGMHHRTLRTHQHQDPEDMVLLLVAMIPLLQDQPIHRFEFRILFFCFNI